MSLPEFSWERNQSYHVNELIELWLTTSTSYWSLRACHINELGELDLKTLMSWRDWAYHINELGELELELDCDGVRYVSHWSDCTNIAYQDQKDLSNRRWWCWRFQWVREWKRGARKKLVYRDASHLKQ